MTVPTMTPAGWYPDPSLRHEFRYWDGMAWSSQVSDRGRMATAPDQGPWTNRTVAQRLDVLVASGSWIEVTELGRAEPQLLAERFLSEARRHPGEKVGAAGIPLSGQVSKPLTPSREDVRFSLVSALRNVGEPAVAPLVSALDSEDDDRISHASWALAEIGEPALDPLLARITPRWSDGSFNTTQMGTIALAAKRSKDTGGQGFLSHMRSHLGSLVGTSKTLIVARLVAGLAGEDDEYASWQDELIDRSLDQGPDACAGVGFTLGFPEEETALKIASDRDVLRTTLEQIPDLNAQLVLRALKRGRAISCEESGNPAGGGYSVTVTLLAGAAKDMTHDGAALAVEEREGEARTGPQAPPPQQTNPAGGPSIILQAADEQMVSQLTSDPYFLVGVLLADGSSAASTFLAAMDEAPMMTHEVSRDPVGAGFMVKLTIYGPPAVLPAGYGAPAVLPAGYGAPAVLPAGYGAPAVLPAASKRPGLHAVASFFIPGLGTLLCGKTARGLLILGLSAVSLFGVTILADALIGGEPTGIGGLLAIPLWVWGMIDGYRSAQQWNLEHPSAAAVEFVTKLSADRKGLDAFTARMRAATPDEQGLLIAAARTRFGEDPFAAWEASAFVSELTLDRKGLDGFQARMAASTPEQQALLVRVAKRCFGDQPLEWWQAVAQARGDRTKVTIAAPPPHGGANKAALLAVGALLGNLNAGALAASVASVSVNDKIHVPTVCNICGVYEGTKSVTVSTTATTSELGKALGGPVMGDIKADLNVPICAVCDKFPTHRKQLVPTLDYLKVQGAWAVVLMVANDVVAERYAILNHAEVSGSTPLAFASWKGHQDTITELLAAGTPVDITDKSGSTPLMLAAAGGHRDTTLTLLAAGANVNATNNVGNTALILAATKGHLDTLAALLAARADVTARDENGTTALMTAAMNGHREIVAALLSAKAEVNAYNNNGNTALILAAFNGHRDTVAALLAARANTTARNKVGKSAADLAAERGHTDVVNQLTGLATLGPLGISQAPTTANQARQPSPQTTNQAPQVTPAWQATTNPAAGWYPDPCTRHEFRYFDGKAWTQHVSDAGQASVDTGPIVAAEETTAQGIPGLQA